MESISGRYTRDVDACGLVDALQKCIDNPDDWACIQVSTGKSCDDADICVSVLRDRLEIGAGYDGFDAWIPGSDWIACVSGWELQVFDRNMRSSAVAFDRTRPVRLTAVYTALEEGVACEWRSSGDDADGEELEGAEAWHCPAEPYLQDVAHIEDVC